MTEMTDHESLMASRFAALATRDSGDWPDVRRRSRRMHRRRVAFVLAATVGAIVLAAPALGLHRVIVDWFHADRASDRTQLEFLQLGVLAPKGMDPGVIPGSARKVLTAHTSRGTYTLSVAPTKAGGFCLQWSNYVGGCTRKQSFPDKAGDLNAWALGTSTEVDEEGTVSVVSGTLLGDDIERLVVEYEDGDGAEIPFVWVSAPIDAGFYLFEIPVEHRARGARATALVATDGEGEEVARQNFRFPRPEDVLRSMRLPDDTIVTLPAKALAEQARKVVEIRMSNGQRRAVWVMPASDGEQCYVFGGGSGCSGNVEPVPLGAGLQGGATVLLAGRVRSDVAIYELRYEDGTIERLNPVEGFILHEITPEHYPRGHRLDRVRALDREGQELARQSIGTGAALYPCQRPIDIGHGVMACP